MDNNFTRALSRILSYSYLILTPLKLIFLKAIPTLVLYLYTILRYGVYYLVLFLRTALVPVLYPLRLFIWRPTMAVLMVVYQHRYLIYFASSALILGSLFGLASFWITSTVVGSGGREKASTSTSTSTRSAIAATPARKDSNTHMKSKKAPSPIYSSTTRSSSSSKQSQIKQDSSSNSKKINHTTTTKSRSEDKTPPILVFEEEVLVKSPLAMPDQVPSSPFSPSKMEDDDHDADVDSQGRDRFAEAMKALSRQRKQARFEAAY